jgi:hypothetical protein
LGFLGCKEYAGHCSDDEVAERCINIVPNHEFEAACLVLPIFFDDFRYDCLVFVDWDILWIYRWVEGNVTLAARDTVNRVDGEGKVAQESVSSREIDGICVGGQFNVGNEGGGECRLHVGLTNLREHRMGHVEQSGVAGPHCFRILLKNNLALLIDIDYELDRL